MMHDQLRRLLGTTAVAVLVGAPGVAVATDETYETEHHQVQVQTVVAGLEHPWGLAFLPDGRFLVTERNPGHLRIGTPDGQLSDPVEGVPEIFRYEGETPRSQSGLFDIVLHPEFAENGWAYISYSRETDHGAAVVVVRGRVVDENGEVRLEDVEDVWVMKQEDQDSSGLHFGGRMAFGADGNLFLAIGDRRNLERAQDATDQGGAVLRMTDEGEVPEDNPEFAAEEASPIPTSTRSAAGTSRRWRCIPSPASSGRPSTGRRAATRST
jgi:aldose sugar dehydrogenase